MEMQQVRYFLALAERLNFTRAAEACNVSQPALTRAIKSLEDELGGPLFHREHSRTHLSELGRMMQPYFQSIYDQTQAAKEQAKSLSSLDQTELKLGAMCTLGPMILSDFICNFHQKFEGVSLNVVDSTLPALGESLAKGDLEIGLARTTENLDERFHAVPLFTERFVIVLPRDHPLAKKNTIEFKDLDGQPYVARVNCEMADEGDKIAARMGVTIPVAFRSERDDWVLGMVRAGMGFGFFPEFSTLPNDVAVRPLIGPEFTRTVSLVTVRGRPHSPAVGAFVRSARSFNWPSSSSIVSPCQ